jgi:hypothetical protein
MYPHRIRLRGPWECEPLARAVRRADGLVEMVEQGLPPPCRMLMPCRWGDGGLADFAGRVRFRRRFGLPRQLDPHEVVWLTFAGVDTAAGVTLNGRFLGRQEQPALPFEFDVTGALKERNELVVDVEAPAGNGGLWGEVALEIRCTAFLRGVRVRRELGGTATKLHIEGKAVGSSDQPLELYVLLGRSTIAYRTIQPSATGEPFAIVYEETRPTTEHQVQVDLVKGAVVWYTVTCWVGTGPG